jgi:LPXTG-motif cell wall-anchored protein
MKKLFFLLMTMLLSTGLVLAQQDAGQEQPMGQAPAATQEAPAQPEPDATQAQPGAAEEQTGALPQTASPLPLLIALGLGSLGTGVIARRRTR